MKALSVRQPWAWGIVHAGKRIENRTWRCHYRGEVFIHTSKLPVPKRYVPDAFIAEFDAMREMAEQAGHVFETLVTYRQLLLESGAIVGRARIVDCVTESNSPWFVGPFGIVLEDVRQTPIVPCKGALGLWEVPRELEGMAVAL